MGGESVTTLRKQRPRPAADAVRCCPAWPDPQGRAARGNRQRGRRAPVVPTFGSRHTVAEHRRARAVLLPGAGSGCRIMAYMAVVQACVDAEAAIARARSLFG